MITFTRLKYLSFAHSAVYLALLALWLSDGPAGPRTVLGWTHGVGWIAMSLLCIAAVRMRVIPLWLAVEALVSLPSGLVMLVGQAWLPADAEVERDSEHDAHAWWPPEPRAWPGEADPALRRMAEMLA